MTSPKLAGLSTVPAKHLSGGNLTGPQTFLGAGIRFDSTGSSHEMSGSGFGSHY